MIPGKYDIEIYQGDSFGPLRLTLPSLVPFGGPADLSAPEVSVEAQIRPRGGHETLLATFTIDVTDPAARKVELTLPPEATTPLTQDGAWDIEVRRVSKYFRRGTRKTALGKRMSEGQGKIKLVEASCMVCGSRYLTPKARPLKTCSEDCRLEVKRAQAAILRERRTKR